MRLYSKKEKYLTVFMYRFEKKIPMSILECPSWKMILSLKDSDQRDRFAEGSFDRPSLKREVLSHPPRAL
jgi:hypothetical protein